MHLLRPLPDRQLPPRGRPWPRQRVIAGMCAGVAGLILAAAFAAVPLYRLFCQTTGYAGTTQRASKPATDVLQRTITVRFDANVGPGLAWRFEPVQRTMVVRIGETALGVYRATNTSHLETTGTATYNVSPDQAGIFFNKLACFCFTEQTLAAGQTVNMPVSFFVDPAMVNSKDAGGLAEITLSYTFYPVAKPRAGMARVGQSPSGG